MKLLTWQLDQKFSPTKHPKQITKTGGEKANINRKKLRRPTGSRGCLQSEISGRKPPFFSSRIVSRSPGSFSESQERILFDVHVLYRKKRILFVFGFDHVFIAAKLRFLFLFAKLSDVHVYMSYTGSSPDSVRCSGRDQPSQGHPEKNLGILQLKLAPCVVRVWRWWTSTGRRMPWEDALSKARRCEALSTLLCFPCWLNSFAS